MLLLRWIGGRSVNQLSLVEFLLVIALGSAVGDSLFYPEVPLGHAMLVILVLVAMNKALDHAILRWDLAKRIVDGDPVQLVRQGVILGDSLNHRTMGQAELSSALRSSGIQNLGEVAAVYMEANGKLSVFRRQQARPGLRIEPPRELMGAGDPPDEGPLCCQTCGLVVEPELRRPDGSCPECHHDIWTRPVLVETDH
jgi:uncharacterized membrane protein YcaP (DUF421 family)